MILQNWPVQKAIFLLLSEDVALGDLITAVHDRQPRKPMVPYVSLGSLTTSPLRAQSVDGQRHRLEIHIWDRAGTDAKLQAITARLSELLHDVDLNVAPLDCVSCRFLSAFGVPDPSDGLRHNVARFEILTTAPVA